jgi:hypothetical protein
MSALSGTPRTFDGPPPRLSKLLVLHYRVLGISTTESIPLQQPLRMSCTR